MLSNAARYRDTLLECIKAECEHDTQFLHHVLRELEPLRKGKRGRAASATQDVIAAGVIRAMKGHRDGEIVERIAATLGLKDPGPNHTRAGIVYRRVRKGIS